MNKVLTEIGLVITCLLVTRITYSKTQITDANAENQRIELKRTDELIDRARKNLRTSNEPTSALVLEQAIGLQKQAWDNFSKGTFEGYAFSDRLTHQARELVKQARSNARFSEEDKDAVSNKLERAKNILRQAQDEMPTTINESRRTIFESAQRNLKLASEFYRNGQYRPAVKLADRVEKTASRLLLIANRQQNFHVNFQRRLEAVKQSINLVANEASDCHSEQAHNLIQNARKALQTAVELASKGRHEAAARHLQKSRKLATDAADLCGRARQFNNALERLTREAERYRDQIGPGDESGMRISHQVFDLLENAKEFMAGQDSDATVAALKAAQLTLKQLERYLDSGE